MAVVSGRKDTEINEIAPDCAMMAIIKKGGIFAQQIPLGATK